MLYVLHQVNWMQFSLTTWMITTSTAWEICYKENNFFQRLPICQPLCYILMCWPASSRLHTFFFKHYICCRYHFLSCLSEVLFISLLVFSNTIQYLVGCMYILHLNMVNCFLCHYTCTFIFIIIVYQHLFFPPELLQLLWQVKLLLTKLPGNCNGDVVWRAAGQASTFCFRSVSLVCA